MNRSNFLDGLQEGQLTYQETEFDNYPMFTTNDVNRRSRDNLKAKEKNRLMQIRQNSTKELNNTLKRVQSKRLTQRGNKRLNDLNASHKYIKNYKKILAAQNFCTTDDSLSQVSPHKRTKKSADRKSGNFYTKPFTGEAMNTSKDNNLALDSVFSKSYGPSKSKIASNYKAALQKLKMQCKKTNNSSSRGRKKVVKISAVSKLQHQATVCNSNTSRKTPVQNTKFGGPPQQRQSKKALTKVFQKFAQLKQISNQNKKFPDVVQKQFDTNTTQNILELIKGMHNNIPRPGVHYRARTTEIGNARHIKRNTHKKVFLEV